MHLISAKLSMNSKNFCSATIFTFMKTDLKLTRTYPADVETFFDAWTKPEWMKRWLFKSPTNQIVKVEVDLRVGGRFSILELADGEQIDHFGEYLEVSRPDRVAFTLEVPWHFKGVSTVAIELRSTDQGCLIDFRQSGIDVSKTEDSWKKMLDNLSIVIAKSIK
jgi:uncharacterized protein YndB with AHSA1/START domain